MQDIQFVGRNFEFSDIEKEYVLEKVGKHENLLKTATNITFTVIENHTDHGDIRNYKAELSVYLPNAFIRVEERGRELNSLIDIIEVILKRRLTRYHDQSNRWSKQEPWKLKEFNELLEENSAPEEIQSYRNYEPKIKRKSYENDTPLHPAEAVEQMELIGHTSFLFKNIESGTHAMVYKRDNGGYGLVEPKPVIT